MFSNNGNYEKDIIRFTGIPFNVSYPRENTVAVTILNKHEVVFVSLITNRIINTVDIGHQCYGTDFIMNRLAIQALPVFTSSHIVYLDPKGQFIERVNISNGNSKNISLRDGTIKCMDRSTICCFTLTGQKIWEFKDESVLRTPNGIALDKNRNVYVAGVETNNVVVLSPDGKNCRQIITKSDGLNEP
jgi:outer membrane protein assembly factor BamB